MKRDATVTASDSPPFPPPETSLRRRSLTATTSSSVSTKLTVSLPNTSSNGSLFPLADPSDQQQGFVFAEASLAASLPRDSPVSPLTYTSLRDLLPQFSSGTINSPNAASPVSSRSGYEISIRNRLVKQAAWAYLQPMSASSESSGSSSLQRFWLHLCSSVGSCLNFIGHDLLPSIANALYRILRSLLCSTR
ncbi:hypothetical protein SAY87_008987 [Trapa incisa]|uniref:Uncharacterized protein n=1 Tax=Trapa incisa TaxID=236973 RepID=A0AAN7JZ38_9MYRT|nr:hypothetical protein SAY87_008987 [Trapa incisa]